MPSVNGQEANVSLVLQHDTIVSSAIMTVLPCQSKVVLGMWRLYPSYTLYML